MTEYTSTREGFQRYMKLGLVGAPEDAKSYVEATATPTFYMIMNGARTDYDDYVKFLTDLRSKITDYDPVVQEFLRDGDQLAARVTGVLTLDGNETAYETFIFAKINKESGKVESIVERGVWEAVGQEPDHGVH